MVVAGNGISLVWRGTWLKRLLLLLALPSLVALFFFAAFELSINDPSMRQVYRGIQFNPRAQELAENSGVELSALSENPESMRHFVWSYFLFTFFRYPQLIGMVMLFGLVAPRLISHDLRSRGYLLYLSRPLRPYEYVFGKACVLYFMLFMTTTVPALIMYVCGLLLSPDPWALATTWDLPIRIVLASIVLILPTAAIALACSSLTQESRYAGFAWFAYWVIGIVTYQTLWLADQRMTKEIEFYKPSRWMLFSPYETLGYLQQEVFGLIGPENHRIMPWIAVVIVSIVGYGIAYWRVARTLKV